MKIVLGGLLILSAVGAGAVMVGRPVQPQASYAGPDSLRVISERRFDGRTEGDWSDRGDRLFEIGRDSTAPMSPPSVGVANFPRGYRSGQGPISTSLSLDDLDLSTVHLTAWVKFSDEWIGNDAGINKVFYVWHHGRPAAAIAAFGAGRRGLELQVRLQNTPGGARNLRPTRRAGVVERGRWQRWDFELVANTPGVRDGSVRWWIDGAEVGYYRDVAIGGVDDSPYWERVSWNPTYGGKGGPVPRLQTIAVDHIIVAGR